MSSAVWKDIGEDVSGALMGMAAGAISGAAFGPYGIIVGAVGGAVVGVGAEVAAQAAQNQADQQKQADQLQESQQLANINRLQQDQATNLANFQADQAAKETAQTESEQSAYTSAAENISQGEEAIGSNVASAVQGGSNIIANAASRGIRVGAGAVQSVASEGQGTQLKMTPGENGTPAVAGQAEVDANTKTMTDPTTGKPVTATTAGQTAKAVTPAVAATPASLDVTQGNVDIYDSAASPLTLLAAQERNANTLIENQRTQVASAANAELTGIADTSATFETEKANNALDFTTQQAETLDAAYMGYDQSVSALGQQEAFTATNLESYDTSLWLNAFSSILSTGSAMAGKLYNPMQTAQQEATTTDQGSGNDDDPSAWGNYNNMYMG